MRTLADAHAHTEHRVCVSAIRDPDDAHTLGWLAQCTCEAYGLWNAPDWARAQRAACAHAAGRPSAHMRRWDWPWRVVWVSLRAHRFPIYMRLVTGTPEVVRTDVRYARRPGADTP